MFFRYTRTGLAFRAVADDQFAALAVGLRLPRIWATVWTAAGVVALVAGLLWGARLGVQFSLSLVVLKALPVLVLGGFDFIAGAIVGGLLIGAIEKLAEVYIGPYFGGGIESWFAYVVALAFLLVRPAACSVKSSSNERRQCLALSTRNLGPRDGCRARLADLGTSGRSPMASFPFSATSYLLEAILTPFLGAQPRRARAQSADRLCRPGIARLAAFMAVGAFAAYNFNLRVHGLPLGGQSCYLAGLRGRDRHRLRPAEPAVAWILSRRLDAGRAVLRAVGADQVRLGSRTTIRPASSTRRRSRSSVFTFDRTRSAAISSRLTIVVVLTGVAQRLVTTQTGR